MLAKVLSGNSGWDVVFPTYNRIAPMRQYNLLAPLREGWLRNLDNLDARFRAPAWDPRLAWGVPYMWYATGIVYNRKVVPPPASWADLWSEKLKGRMTMLDDPEDVLGACLKKLDLPFSATGPEDLRRARTGSAGAKAPAPRVPERGGARPARGGGRAGGAVVVHHGAAGHRCRAAPCLRLPRRGLPALLRLRRSAPREPPPGTGAPVHRLPAAPACFGRRGPGHAHGYGECRRAARCCPKPTATTRLSIPRPKSSAAANGRPRCPRPPSACATASGPRSKAREREIS